MTAPTSSALTVKSSTLQQNQSNKLSRRQDLMLEVGSRDGGFWAAWRRSKPAEIQPFLLSPRRLRSFAGESVLFLYEFYFLLRGLESRVLNKISGFSIWPTPTSKRRLLLAGTCKFFQVCLSKRVYVRVIGLKRGVMWFIPLVSCPRATHEGNKSHNHELKADKRLIFTLARIPQGMQNTLTKNASIVHLSFVF